MNLVFILLFRILQGDRLRRPTPEEEREWAGLFLLIGIGFGLTILTFRYARHFCDTASAFTLTVIAAVVVSVLVFVPKIWGRHVPAKVSWILAAIVWPLLFLLALTGHLG
jgi:CHASE2 domain-containing sensor protein